MLKYADYILDISSPAVALQLTHRKNSARKYTRDAQGPSYLILLSFFSSFLTDFIQETRLYNIFISTYTLSLTFDLLYLLYISHANCIRFYLKK